MNDRDYFTITRRLKDWVDANNKFESRLTGDDIDEFIEYALLKYKGSYTKETYTSSIKIFQSYFK